MREAVLIVQYPPSEDVALVLKVANLLDGLYLPRGLLGADGASVASSGV